MYAWWWLCVCVCTYVVFMVCCLITLQDDWREYQSSNWNIISAEPNSSTISSSEKKCYDVCMVIAISSFIREVCHFLSYTPSHKTIDLIVTCFNTITWTLGAFSRVWSTENIQVRSSVWMVTFSFPLLCNSRRRRRIS